VIFGLDFQYSWPLDMLAHVGLQGLPWRQVVTKLASGDKQTGLPPMSVPKTYCKQLNTWLVGKKKDKLYWCPLKGRASSYGIPQSSPVPKGFQVYRLTELQSPLKGESKPKPANAVGGMGLGIVGGQTICGIPQIGRLLARQDVAVWPFDGLDIADPSYADKHVAVEIYPSAIRPAGVPQTDENDARCSTEYVQEHDAAGTLQFLLNLTGISGQYQQQVQLEGWILGMNPARL
jgi:hypothetical protein